MTIHIPTEVDFKPIAKAKLKDQQKATELQERIKDVKDNISFIAISHDRILSSLLGEITPINFQKKGNFSDSESLTQKHYVILSIEEILSIAVNRDLSLCMNSGSLFAFNGEYWKPIQKEELISFLGEAAEKLGVAPYTVRHYSLKNELYKQFLSTAYLPKPKSVNEGVLINLKNGTFVISKDEQKLRDFDKNDFLTYQLPFEWDRKAQAPQFKKYLDRVLPDATLQNILAECIGNIFVKNHTLKLEKALILYGNGANGKSVFFEIVTAMLGSQNVSNYSLQSLTDDKGYNRAMISNTLVNYASEISPRMNSTVFKQMVSGEPIEARLPFKDPFILEDYAKLIFNTNDLPVDVEQNEAFFRRFIIMPFSVLIPEEERDPQLSQKIIQSELPGVFNWTMEGMKRLLSQKGFTRSVLIDNLINEYRIKSDSVQLFLIESNYEKDPTSEKSLKVLYNEYRDFCSESGYKSASNKTFAARLRNQGYEVVKQRLGNVVGIKKVLTQTA